MKSLFRKRLRGGGNRSEARDIVREAAKQLGSEAAKVGRHCYADSETKVVSEIAAISRHSERLAKESSNTNLIQLVGRHCYADNET